MKVFTLSVMASILALTIAVPFEKRVLVIQTVTDVVVTTVESTTTVSVKPHQPTNAAHLAQHVHNHAHKHPAPAAAPMKAAAPVPAHPQSPEAPSPVAVANKAVAPAPAPVAPSPKEAAPVVQQAPKQATAVYKAPSAPAPALQPPSPPAPPPAPAPQANSYSSATTSSGSTGDCGKVGMPCSGDITFYNAGVGACGSTNDGTTEKVFALAVGMMGDRSNGNAFCGRHAKISLDGKTVVGKLVDKCGGCKGQSIDLSRALFDALAPEGKGRIPDVKWHFID